MFVAAQNFYSPAINAYPNFHIDGTYTSHGSSSTFEAALANRRNVDSPLWFDLNVHSTNSLDSVIATLRAVSNTQMSSGYTVKFFLVEPHLAISNAPNGEVNWNFNALMYANGGVFTHSGSTSDTVTYRAAFARRNSGTHPYTLDNCGVIAWVRNESTKQVMQSVYSRNQMNIPALYEVSHAVTDETGNHDGRVDPGEIGTMTVTLADAAYYLHAPGTVATMTTSVPGITMLDSVANYGDIAPGSNATNTSHPFRFQVGQDVPAQYATFTMNITVDTLGYNTSITFPIRLGRPQYLLVESDSTVDVASMYITNMQNLGIDYDLWNRDSIALPQSVLLSYSKCIWFTGYLHNNILSPTDKASVMAFVDAGRKLLFTSQNALEWAVATDSVFARDYLRATLVSSASSIHQFNGVAGDPYFDNMFLRTVGAGGASDADNPTSMQPRGNSVGMLTYNGTSDFAGVYYSQGDARVVYLGIPFEAISGSASTPRDTLLNRINQFFDGALSTPDIRGTALPNRVELSDAYPNPFNPTTTVRLSLPVSSKVIATVYDISGRQVQSLVSGTLNAGTHSFTIDLSRQTSGVYFLQVKTNGIITTRKLALLK